MTTLEGLQTVRDLLRDESRWIQGAPRKRKGTTTCYCLSGAILTIPDETRMRVATALRGELIERHYSPNIIRFNDAPHRTHKDIISLIDGAIAVEVEKCTRRQRFRVGSWLHHQRLPK